MTTAALTMLLVTVGFYLVGFAICITKMMKGKKG